MGRTLLPLGLLLAGCTTGSGPVGVCTMASADQAWLEGALSQWQVAEQQWLDLPPAPLPQVVAIDSACTYTMPEGQVALAEGVPHGGESVDLGNFEVPLGPIAFADGSGRFVMSLPSVWRAAGISSSIDFEVFLEGVMLHEIMHTRQSTLASDALGAIEARHPDFRISDDLVQDTFSDDPAYVGLYETERDTLFAAAAAPDDETARYLAGEALGLMRQRRAMYFHDARDFYAELEDVFLTMEGMGQFMMLSHFRNQPGVSAELALREALSGDYWTQNQGLALWLVLDRLLPDWRERAFREPDWRAEQLLAAAVAG
ncbi:hypothetical protein [Aurantiacibacter hainanensis]|uniref:hypothetical protein n=1 Tax=Aurantiacibacter hainanensis TaxID=3076114 RepID=UPI0030C72688